MCQSIHITSSGRPPKTCDTFTFIYGYGFNYYGTIGTNRDEFVVVRKMHKVDWLDGEAAPTIQA